MSLPGFAARGSFRERQRLRDKDMLAATVVAIVDASEEPPTADAVATALGVGLGRVIAARDRLVRDGYLVRDGRRMVLTEQAREALQTDSPAAA